MDTSLKQQLAPKMPAKPGQRQTEARRPEFNLDLSYGAQGLSI